ARRSALVTVQTGRGARVVMDGEAVRRSLFRIAHEILERNRGAEDLVLVGIMARGDLLAARLAAKIEELEGRAVEVRALDPSGHRDDLHLGPPAKRPPSRVSNVDGKVV